MTWTKEWGSSIKIFRLNPYDKGDEPNAEFSDQAHPIFC